MFKVFKDLYILKSFCFFLIFSVNGRSSLLRNKAFLNILKALSDECVVLPASLPVLHKIKMIFLILPVFVLLFVVL